MRTPAQDPQTMQPIEEEHTDSMDRGENPRRKNVVYEHHNGNTITVQSTKVIGEYNYSFVSVSPTKKAMIDTPMLKKIKAIQAQELKTWKGLQVEYISRPGQANLYQPKKNMKIAEYFRLEDDRFRIFLEGLIRYREWEEERLNSVYQNQFQEQAPRQREICLKGSEYLVFKNLKDPTLLLKDGLYPVQPYQKTAMAGAASATGGFLDQTHHDLLYKLIKTDGKLIRAVLETNGFMQTEAHDWNVLWTCQSLKPQQYEGLNENQKINHFPQSYELTRKDRLCYNIVQMQEKFGKEEFNIIPDTYILPDEFADFYSHYHKLKSKEQSNLWIIKPQNSSQGKGIYIIDDISEVPIDEACIVSKYITNPLLINGLKFDLRIYVLVTSIDPWRVYVYHEGLARFASEPYAPQTSKQNKFAHLTNYSINKKNEKYIPNQTAEQDDTGHKWSLAALSKHLEQIGLDLNHLWSKIYDVIIKSLLSIDSVVYQNLKKLPNKNNCFELLGYDILIDSELKPWLMEVNLSPSLATDSPLDVKIKTGLMVDTFNLVGIRKFDKRRDNLTKMKNRVKNIMRAKSYQSRQNNPQQNGQTKGPAYAGPEKKPFIPGKIDETMNSENDFFFRNKQLFERISQINGRYRDMIRETLQEHQRKNNFVRIYPAKNSDMYDHYFITPRPSNKFLHRYLFSDDIIHYPTGYPGLPGGQKSTQVEDISIEKATDIQTVSNISSQFSSNQAQHYIHQSSNSDFTKVGMIGSNQVQPRLNSAALKTKQDNANSKRVLPQQNQAPQNPTTPSQQPSQSQTSSTNIANVQQQLADQQQQKEKLLITGDDVLIEYVARLMIAVKSIKEHMLRPSWKNCIEKFIKHYVWHTSDVRRAENNKLWQRLESRLIEMKERRKRLLKSLYKKENPQHLQQMQGPGGKQSSLTTAGILDFEKVYELKEEQKNVIIQGFSAAQLEEMLRTSTKNVAYEVISCLIDTTGKGVLTEIIKWLTTCNQNLLNDQDSILNQLSRKKDLDESEEEPESFIYAPTGAGKLSGQDSSNGSTSITSGNSGDVRIKIRKNSMDPHSKMKANHSQVIQQKMKQQEAIKGSILESISQQQQHIDTGTFSFGDDKIMSLSPMPNVHQKAHSSLATALKGENDIQEGMLGNQPMRENLVKTLDNHDLEELKEPENNNNNSLYSSPHDKSNRSFTQSKVDDFSTGSRFNLQRFEDVKKQQSIESDRKRTISHLEHQQVQISSALQFKAVNTLESSSSKSNILQGYQPHQQSQVNTEKTTPITNNTYFKTYSSQFKNDILGIQSQLPTTNMVESSSSNQYNHQVMNNINISNNAPSNNSAYGNYLSNSNNTSNSTANQTNFIQQVSIAQQQVQAISQQSQGKKPVKMSSGGGASSSQRKTYSSVKRGANLAMNPQPNSGNNAAEIGDMKKNSSVKVNKQIFKQN